MASKADALTGLAGWLADSRACRPESAVSPECSDSASTPGTACPLRDVGSWPCFSGLSQRTVCRPARGLPQGVSEMVTLCSGETEVRQEHCSRCCQLASFCSEPAGKWSKIKSNWVRAPFSSTGSAGDSGPSGRLVATPGLHPSTRSKMSHIYSLHDSGVSDECPQLSLYRRL